MHRIMSNMHLKLFTVARTSSETQYNVVGKTEKNVLVLMTHVDLKPY